MPSLLPLLILSPLLLLPFLLLLPTGPQMGGLPVPPPSPHPSSRSRAPKRGDQ